MPRSRAGSAEEATYPLGTASRLTGLSPELLRAWERRYGVVVPLRTEGGTRRYRADDIERLRLVKAAVDAGHRIGQIARLDPAELQRRADDAAVPDGAPIGPVLSAVERLDAAEAQRLLSLQLSALGPLRFAHDVALPLVQEIGERWASGRLPISSEHLATGILRSMLGSALLPTTASLLGPRIVFATPAGERHELGLQMAALTALGSGATPIYLGADLPVDDLLDAVVRSGAGGLALSLVTIDPAVATRAVNALRGGLSEEIRLWIGGSGAADVDAPPGVERISSLDDLEQRVALWSVDRGRSR